MTETQDNPYVPSSPTMKPVRWVLQVRRSVGVGYVDSRDLPYEQVANMREQIEIFNREHSYPQYRIVTR